MAPPPKSPHLYLVEDRGYETPCWIWQRALNSGGYGVMRTGEGSKTLTLAHRKFWEDEHGPVPEGMELDHLCRVEACVRASHLEPVIHAENCRRGAQTKLSYADVEEIRERVGQGERKKAVAAAFSIDEATVRSIVNGTLWAAA